MPDFRSDTLTNPTPAMREAMAGAVVGDDVYGEDPTVRELEERGAETLGVEATVFVPSGTMGNQAAIHVHCRPGDELICEARSHVYMFEAGSVARLSGTQVRTLVTERGFPTPAQVADAVRSDNDHNPRTRLLVIENTHNMAGGTVLGPDGMHELVDVARRHGLAVHLDGARVVNAAVASGCQPADIVRGVDSVSMCLSKGLGAPIGSLVGGSAAFAAEARRARKAFGGGMRQVGVIAAPALLALADGPRLVAEDHRRAADLASRLGSLEPLRVTPPDSNIVMVDLPGYDAAAVHDDLASRGVRVLTVGPERLRLVTHRELTDRDVDTCVRAFESWVRTTRMNRGTRAKQ